MAKVKLHHFVILIVLSLGHSISLRATDIGENNSELPLPTLLDSFNQVEGKKPEEIISLGTHLLKRLDENISEEKIAKVDVYNQLSSTFILNGNYSDSFSNAKKAKLLADEAKYELGLGQAFKNIANFYTLIDNYELALNNNLKSLEYARKLGNNLEIARTLNNIAQIYSKIERNDESISVFLESIEILNKIGNKKFKAYALGGMADSYKDKNNLTESLHYFNLSLDLLKEIDDKSGLAVTHNLMGEVHLQANNFIEAKKNFDQSLVIAKEYDIWWMVTEPYLNLSKLAYLEKNYTLAKKYANKALEIASERKESENKSKSLKILSQVAESERNFKVSLNFYKRHKNAEREIFNEKRDRNISAMVTVFEVDQLDRKNQFLEQQNELIQINVEKEKTQKLIILIFFLLITISIAFAYYRFVHNKKLQQEKLINEQLQSVNKLKDQILMNTSHEFRTPLTGIIGLAECLQEELMGPQSKESKENLALIVNSGRRLNSLVDDILNFAQLKSGNFEMYISTVNIHRLVADVVTTCSPLLLNKPITIRNNLQENRLFALADEKRLVQVLYNLIGNAIKYSNQGEISITAETDGDEIKINVSDEGIGIPADKLEFIFEYFEQLDASSSRTQQGSGLGLAITKKLIELQNGRISVESTLDKGSVFSFTLPIASEPVTTKMPAQILS